VMQAVGAGAGSLLFGLLGFGAAGLCWGLAAGQALAAVVVISGSARVLVTSHRFPSPREVRRIASLHRGFPLSNAPHVLVDGLRDGGIALLIASVIGTTVNGLLAVALRVLKVPSSLVGTAMGQVFYQRSARMRNEGRPVKSFVRSLLVRSACASLPVFLGVAMLGPWLFGAVFGAAWTPAGSYARLLAPSLFVGFLASQLSFLPALLGRQRTAFRLNLLDTTTRLLAVYAGATLAGGTGAIAGLGLAGVSMGLVQLAWYIRIAAVDDRAELDGGVPHGQPA
jgi:lipopolysaccharide exporter